MAEKRKVYLLMQLRILLVPKIPYYCEGGEGGEVGLKTFTQTDRHTHKYMDITTYRLNWTRGRFSERSSMNCCNTNMHDKSQKIPHMGGKASLDRCG